MVFTTGSKFIFPKPTTTQTTTAKYINMKTLNGTRAEAPQMYETENDISKDRRTQLNALLNQRLASAVDLQMQMKQAHWNVKGPSFIGLHELFDKVAEAVEGYVDEIAERIVQLGGVAEGTVRMAAARSRLTEYSPEISEGMAHVESVARALSTFGQEARSTINEADELDDADTADLFTEVSRGIDKWLWFVEAHSQATK
jgi:starvation-inducible DNA-binding protein